jgi:DNA-binding beta-propeller fold protein YncE
LALLVLLTSHAQGQQVVATLTATGNPQTVVVNPVTNRWYVANLANGVDIYDGATMTFKTSYTGVGAPWTVQVTPKYVYW